MKHFFTHIVSRSPKSWLKRCAAAFAALLMTSIPTMAQTSPEESTPTANGSYYLYNVGQKKYAANDNGKLVLSESASMLVTLHKNRQNGESGTADTNYYFVVTPQGEMSANYLQEPRTDGTGKHNQWMFTKVEGETNVYNISCKTGREGNGSLYLYYGPISGRLSLAMFMPELAMQDAQWMLVAENDVEKQIIDLKEEAESYTVPTLTGSSATVHLYRTFSAEAWNSFCVPFDISASQISSQFGSEARVAEYTSYANDIVKFVTTTSVTAGRPYIIYIPKQETTKDYYEFEEVSTFAESPTPETKDGITFTGCFAKGTAPEGSYVLRKNEVYHLQSSMEIKGFRGYMTATETTTKKIADWSLDGQATGIRIVESNIPEGDVYNVAGQKVRSNTNNTDQLPRGIYIIGGRKVIK